MPWSPWVLALKHAFSLATFRSKLSRALNFHPAGNYIRRTWWCPLGRIGLTVWETGCGTLLIRTKSVNYSVRRFARPLPTGIE
jgi:hypothetical protein